MMENKVCKRCHRPLPEEYKYSKCEACRNIGVQTVKKTLKPVLGVVATIGATAITIATKGKIDIRRK